MTVERWSFGDPVAPLIDRLRGGGVLAIPTESSYGLGADPRDSEGVEAIYRVKGRDRGKALPVVVADVEQLTELVGEENRGDWVRALDHWPAPLSVLVSVRRGALPAAAGEDAIAVRVPAHVPLRELLAEVGPLTATSANRSGEPPILDPGGLESILAGSPATIVDGGVLPGGAPSTLVDLRSGAERVLRAGAHPWETPAGARP